MICKINVCLFHVYSIVMTTVSRDLGTCITPTTSCTSCSYVKTIYSCILTYILGGGLLTNDMNKIKMKETLPCLFFLDLRFLITPLVSSNTSCSTFRTVPKYNRKVTETETKLISITQIYMTSYFPSLSQIGDRIRILKFNLDDFSVNFCTFNRFTIISKSNICSFHVYNIVITTAFRGLALHPPVVVHIPQLSTYRYFFTTILGE